MAYLAVDWFTFTPAALPLKAAISSSGETDIKFESPQYAAISPMCGCNREESELWRGITFIARSLAIYPIAEPEPPNTLFITFSPTPGNFSYGPNMFDMRATEYEVKIPQYTDFTTDLSEDGPPIIKEAVSIKETQHGFVDSYIFRTKEQLHLVTLGEIPYGSWSPIRESSVRLKTQHDPLDLSRVKYSIGERFYKQAGDPDVPPNNERYGDYGFPSLDLMGKTIWLDTLDRTESGISYYVFVKLEVPYALRVLVIGDWPELLDKKTKTLKPVGPRLHGGTTGLWFEKTQGDIQAFREASAGIASDSFNFARPIPRPPIDPKTGKKNPEAAFQFMIMRPPPAPPSDGFNVFGELSSMKMSHASGSVMIGAQQWSVANAQLNLTQLRGLVREGPAGSVPIQLDGDSIHVDSAFSATGMVSINGSPITTTLRKWDAFVQRSSLLALVGSIVTLAISFAVWMWTRFQSRG